MVEGLFLFTWKTRPPFYKIITNTSTTKDGLESDKNSRVVESDESEDFSIFCFGRVHVVLGRLEVVGVGDPTTPTVPRLDPKERHYLTQW